MSRPYLKPLFDIGQIIRSQAESIQSSTTFTTHQKRILRAIADCRTAALGTHKVACTDCGSIQFAYHSCRNRNCPKCQNRQREAWIKNREKELLPLPYFHLVFTLPSELNQLCLHYPKVMYRFLFEATWYTVNKLGKDQKWVGAKLGMIAILHTWGSNLSLHPHLHCMVPAGGLTKNGQWKSSKSKGKYLFNRGIMGSIFRARYVKLLRKAVAKKELPFIPDEIFKTLFSKEWITFAKRPFMGPQQILNYIGRYSHKIAITNHRIVHVNKNEVHFRYKNYRKGGKQKVMKLSKKEFVRRFSMHIIPHKFIRIRHYGILSNRNKKTALVAARKALGATPLAKVKPKTAPVLQVNQSRHYCACCKKMTVHLLLDVIPPNRGSPNKTVQAKV